MVVSSGLVSHFPDADFLPVPEKNDIIIVTPCQCMKCRESGDMELQMSWMEMYLIFLPGI